jgi:hypothetical protein
MRDDQPREIVEEGERDGVCESWGEVISERSPVQPPAVHSATASA